MERVDRLAEKILNRFEEHRHNLADKQQQLDIRMKEMLEQRERLAAIAKTRIETVVLPRLEELTRHFDNAKVTVLNIDANSTCIADFAHTPSYPAIVKLGITLLPGENESLSARYDLSILPELMKFTRNVDEVFPLDGDAEALAGWVEERVLDFIDTYLCLESHPLYQKNNTVLDIVCGMHIPSASATSSVVRQGRTFYFCSEHCKEVFLKENN
jgi:YHS domain-containing protein